MKFANQFFEQPLFPFILWMLLYYLSGIISDNLSPMDVDIYIVWFPAGVATTAFLLSSWYRWPLLLVGFVLLNLCFESGVEGHLATSLLHSFSSMPTSIMIAWLVRRYARQGDDLQTIMLWLMVTFFVSLADAAFFSIGINRIQGNHAKELFWDGFITDFTGIIFTTIVLMGLVNRRLLNEFGEQRRVFAGGVVLILLCISALAIFSGTAQRLYVGGDIVHMSLTCLPIALCVALSLLWGNRGGSLALLVLSSISIYFTKNEQGPFFIQGLYRYEPILLIQGYLSMSALLIVFLRILNRGIYHFDDTSGQHATYLLNINSGEIEWGNISQDLTGMDMHALTDKLRVLQRVHQDDRKKLMCHWLPECSNAGLPVLTFRIRDEEGNWLVIEDRRRFLMKQPPPAMVVGNWFVTNSKLRCYDNKDTNE